MKARNIIEKDRATENEHNIIFVFVYFFMILLFIAYWIVYYALLSSQAANILYSP